MNDQFLIGVVCSLFGVTTFAMAAEHALILAEAIADGKREQFADEVLSIFSPLFAFAALVSLLIMGIYPAWASTIAVVLGCLEHYVIAFMIQRRDELRHADSEGK